MTLSETKLLKALVDEKVKLKNVKVEQMLDLAAI